MNQQTFPIGGLSPVTTLREQSEAKKQFGMMLSAERRAELVAAGQVALLRAILQSSDGTATVDDATADLSTKFEKGGKWRGSIPSRLARRRIIERVGDCKSDRPSRHRGYVSVWRVTNRDRAQKEIERLSAMLDATKENPQAAATDCGLEVSTDTQSTTSGATENASF